MANPFVGEIRMFGGSFAPAGWMFCAGQLLPISENETLFNLIGTTYGGDGQETFALPDLQGRVPMHQGNGHVIGEKAGTEQVSLTVQQLPIHAHTFLGAQETGTDSNPANAILATSSVLQPYAAEAPDANMAAGAISPAGGSQPHENMQPYLTISLIISLFGIFPPPT